MAGVTNTGWKILPVKTIRWGQVRLVSLQGPAAVAVRGAGA